MSVFPDPILTNKFQCYWRFATCSRCILPRFPVLESCWNVILNSYPDHVWLETNRNSQGKTRDPNSWNKLQSRELKLPIKSCCKKHLSFAELFHFWLLINIRLAFVKVFKKRNEINKIIQFYYTIFIIEYILLLYLQINIKYINYSNNYITFNHEIIITHTKIFITWSYKIVKEKITLQSIIYLYYLF